MPVLTPPISLSLLSDGTPVTAGNVINPNYNLINTNFSAIYNKSQRSLGNGWEAGELADKSVLSRNYMPQTNRVYSTLGHGTGINTNGNGGTSTATDSVTTLFANARVKLKASHSFEPVSNAGSYTMVSYIERSSSPLFSTTTIIAQGSQVVTITNNGAQTAWATILADGIDTLATAGTYYYRYRVAFYVYNNAPAVSNTAITTVGLLTRTNYLDWEVTNGSTL